MIRALAVGDAFIPASAYVRAFESSPVELRTVDWRGEKADHHRLQQQMETGGANMVAAPAELLAALGGIQAVCLHFAPVNAEVIGAAPDLELIAVARAGLENVDLEAASARGIAVVRAMGRNAGAVAELQIALMLAEARNVARADASVKAGGWRKEFPGAQFEIAESTVGMVGFGHVGQVFARRLAGFGARLLAHDPYVDSQFLTSFGVEPASLDQVFSQSDFVVVQARHTPDTDRFIDASLLSLMKPNAYFINVSRSRVVDTDALLEVLSKGAIGGAGLDVFDSEPLPDDSPWRSLDNVTLTTHFGGDTENTNRTSASIVAAAVIEYARTGRVVGAVNAADIGWE